MADRITLSGAPEGLDALRVAERLGEDGTALFIARDASRAAQFIDAIGFFAGRRGPAAHPAARDHRQRRL